jgi:hypothetical protein
MLYVTFYVVCVWFIEGRRLRLLLRCVAFAVVRGFVCCDQDPDPEISSRDRCLHSIGSQLNVNVSLLRAERASAPKLSVKSNLSRPACTGTDCSLWSRDSRNRG